VPIIVLLIVILAGLALWAGWRARQRHRRGRVFRRPLDPAKAAILACRVPQYRRLPTDLQRRLEGLVNVFLDEMRFDGCDGLEVSEAMRLAIAGHACLLLLGGTQYGFNGFQTVLVYPDAFMTRQTRYDGMVEIEEHSVRSGESWHRGPVVLAWADIEEDLAHAGDGRNVVLHEFAHKLDEENADMDGLPVLPDPAQQAGWARVLQREYDELRRRAEAGRPSFLDPYGAESPAEFFAVATEAFFETGARMRRELPDLYEQLQGYYRLDPAAWEH